MPRSPPPAKTPPAGRCVRRSMRCRRRQRPGGGAGGGCWCPAAACAVAFVFGGVTLAATGGHLPLVGAFAKAPPSKPVAAPAHHRGRSPPPRCDRVLGGGGWTGLARHERRRIAARTPALGARREPRSRLPARGPGPGPCGPFMSPTSGTAFTRARRRHRGGSPPGRPRGSGSPTWSHTDVGQPPLRHVRERHPRPPGRGPHERPGAQLALGLARVRLHPRGRHRHGAQPQQRSDVGPCPGAASAARRRSPSPHSAACLRSPTGRAGCGSWTPSTTAAGCACRA